MSAPDKLPSCVVCGSGSYPEYTKLVDIDLCCDCACRIANAYNKAHSGRWLTWRDEPLEPRGFQKRKIPHGIRRAVYERDAYRCVKCGTHLDLTLDHIKAEVKGGEATVENLRVLCRSCNCRKGDRDE